MQSQSNKNELTVYVNGCLQNYNLSGIQRFGDFIELVKSSIDPDHMIIEVVFNGEELKDSDWESSLSKFSGGTFEIKTDQPERFALSRLVEAPNIVNAIFKIFREARMFFNEGKMAEGNKVLINAVTALKEFITWYHLILELLPEDRRTNFLIETTINELTKSCSKITEAQLYGSWWMIAEMIKANVEPALDDLEVKLRSAVNQVYKR
jgi:hypothetical protein